MWGLIYKDIIMNKKTLIIPAVASAALFMIMTGALFFANDSSDEYIETTAQFISLLATICVFLPWLDLPTMLIKNDERKAWCGFVSASPVTAKGQVASKYALCFIILVITVNILYFFLQIGDIILYSISGKTAMASAVNIAVSFAFAIMFIWAVEIPFTVYFGSKTGGAVKMLIFLAVFLGFIIYGLYGKTKLSFDGLWEMLFSDDIKIYAFMIGSEIIFAAAYLLSYLLSCRLYLKGAEKNG